MVQPVLSWMYQFQLILDVALIVLFLEGLDYFGVLFLLVLGVHLLYVLLEQLLVLLVCLAVGLYFERGEQELLVLGQGWFLLLRFFALVFTSADFGSFGRFLLFLVVK